MIEIDKPKIEIVDVLLSEAAARADLLLNLLKEVLAQLSVTE